MRTTRESVTFDHPFSLAAVGEVQPAGTYIVEIDEELIDGLSFLAYRRVATTIYLPLHHRGPGSIQAVRVEPRELAAESQLDRVEQRIYDNRIVVEAANARVKAWFDGKKAGFDASRASWTENRQVHLLNTRADDAEAYAGAVFDLAAAAADEAAQAALEALLARNDAKRAAMPEIWAGDDEAYEGLH